MKKILFVFLITFLYNNQGFAQDIFISGQTGKMILTWDDFLGKPDKTSTHDAFTNWNVSYSFGGTKLKGDTIFFTLLKVKLEFNGKESWIKREKSTNELLMHEQGHFDIGRLCSLELQKTFNTTIFLKSNFQTKPQLLFDSILKKYNQMGLDYDKETDHSKNKAEQLRWNLFFQSQLSQTTN